MTSASKMPEWLEPMAATLTQDRFAGPEWLFERKFDGIRLLAYKRGGQVQLFSRNRLPQHLPALETAVAGLPVDEVILDGEVTWDGRSGYHVFDILWLDGRAVTALPLEDRRALLQRLPFEPPMRRVELVDDDAPWERARREGWEGVIAKRRGSPYEHRRSKYWLKMKCEAAQEFVVGGFTDPQGARVGLGALLVGYHEGDDLRKPRAFPACARTGCARRSSCRSRSSNGPCTESSGIRGCSRSAATRTHAPSSGSSRDHPSRQGALSRGRHYQGRPGRLLRGHGLGTLLREKSSGARRIHARSICGTCPGVSPAWAICGPTCGVAGDRCGGRWRSCAGSSATAEHPKLFVTSARQARALPLLQEHPTPRSAR